MIALLIFQNFLKVYLFILRERESTSRVEAERRRDRIPTRLRVISAEPDGLRTQKL